MKELTEVELEILELERLAFPVSGQLTGESRDGVDELVCDLEQHLGRST